MDSLHQEMGFDSEADFHRLIASLDVSTPERLAAFQAWQQNDGTKAGALLLPVQD